ncbi:MAG: hypothetical protein H0W14_00465 [Actinobacteria bacterium]|nr:hypothetical protein [Actinomycetota bacterium]
MVQRTWWTVLGALAALRVAPPLLVLAAEGRDLPGFPRFDLVEGTGDDAGFYAAAREFMASTARATPAGGADRCDPRFGGAAAGIRLRRRKRCCRGSSSALRRG